MIRLRLQGAWLTSSGAVLLLNIAFDYFDSLILFII